MTATTAGRPTVVLLLLTMTALATGVRSHPFDYVNVTRLAAVADDFRQHWSTARGGQVKMRLRPDGVPSSWSDNNETTVCGYKFMASADDPSAGVDDARHLPAPVTFRCDGNDEYRVNLAAGGGGDDAFAGQYDAIASLGAGARVDTVRLETTGVTAVPLVDLCFGFLDGASVRAFCADVDLLTACHRMSGSSNLDFGSTTHVQLGARRRYTCREIVFRDVHGLARAFEALASHGDDETARHAVCQRIGFVNSNGNLLEGCLGQSVGERAAAESTESQFAFISADRFADVNSAYERCERSNDETSSEHANVAADDGGVGSLQTSSGQRISSSLNGFLFLLFSVLTFFTRTSPL